MSDIIKVLPDAIANQIAAGEVVQRPASVIKELADNALDAGASKIEIYLENAGKDLIRVIDNGCGMSLTDARMAFERHATSKINKADDLFHIRTMGFRGEALASIAAVANVDLKTRQEDDDLGTHLVVNGSEVTMHEQTNCAQGSHFIVKSLFFNIPARRKFLKTNATELRHIVNQMQRLALAHPQVEFKLVSDNDEIYNLPQSNLKQRIVNLWGSGIQSQLIAIESETSYASLHGFIGKPNKAKKKYGEQFFFVNNRYIRHPYLHKAVVEAYGQLLPTECVPTYFIFIEISPDLLDVNIHPTKTEVKFEDERTLFQLVLATVKESLGKFNIVPSIDFEVENGMEIPTFRPKEIVKSPDLEINPEYNPFKPTNTPSGSFAQFNKEKSNTKGWESFYDFESLPKEETPVQMAIDEDKNPNIGLFQLKGKYILSQVKSGILFVHQQRAHERIVYEQLTKQCQTKHMNTQKLLFPHIIELNAKGIAAFGEIADDLQMLGFDIDLFGKSTIAINGLPGGVTLENPQLFIEDLLQEYHGKDFVEEQLIDTMVRNLAKAATHHKPQSLSQEEMQQLVDSLFSCSTPNHTPDGRKIVHIMPLTDIDKYFG